MHIKIQLISLHQSFCGIIHLYKRAGSDRRALNIANVKEKAKGSAAGQYLGFALQEIRLFYHLLTCPEDADVGLEYVDDVSVHIGDATICAEQCKSALKGNPISNWSPEFWKTLANWLANIENGVLDPEETRFQMYVVPVKNPGFAGLFGAIITDTEIDTKLAELKKRHEALSKIPECEAHYQAVFSTNPAILRHLIRNFELLNTDDEPFAPVFEFLAATLRPEMRESAARFGIGDAKRRIDEAIRSGKPPVVNAAEFRRRFYAFISAHDNERFLHSLSETPSDDIIVSTISRAPCFIQQLDLVDAAVEHKMRATSDLLRTTVDRTRWAEEGEIFEGSLQSYDDTLTRRHHNLQTEVVLSHPDLPDTQRGLLLYAKCCNSGQIPLEGRVVPEHFLSGTLNQLSDRRQIGWHPDFEKLLGSE